MMTRKRYNALMVAGAVLYLAALLGLVGCAPAVERTDAGEHPQWEVDAWYAPESLGVEPQGCITDYECEVQAHAEQLR
jgi:hypothetical protein